MLFGNRRPRIADARRLTDWSFQPRGELLEMKLLLAAIDLGGTSPPILPRSASAPYGINEAGATPSAGAGWSVADIGDLTGNGYDDILVGAPTVNGSPSKLGTATGGSAYLIFGSQYVNSSNAVVVQNWLNTTGGPNLTANDRVGSLAQLGTQPQQNPITGTAGGNLDFPFAGITFTATGVDANSSFGTSVAEVKFGSSFGILIGAPNAPDANNDAGSAGTGKVFLITGNFLSMNGKTVDVDTPSTYGNLTVVTIESNANGGGQLGYSVAGGLNILADGQGDVIIGAPFATIGTTANGGTPVANTGAVYVISTSLMPTGSTTFNVSTAVGTGSNSRAVIFAGEADGDEAGWSVADAGNVNGATGSVDDLLIGAPDNLGIGAAYLVYGGSNVGTQATLTHNVFYISLSRVGGTATGSLSGAKIVGPGATGETGFSVSPAGDFNADGLADFMIGTPLTNAGSVLTDQGEVDLIYGAASGITGTLTLGSLPATVRSATFTGADAGDMAGYSESEVGVINSGQPTGILIGAPGYNSDNGTAYLIMGRTGLTGSFSLATAQAAPLSGLQFVETTPSAPSSSPPFFGASVSGRLQGTQQNTVDLDDEADFAIGAPGYDVTQTTGQNLAGGVQIVESGFLVVPIPTPSGITAQIGIGTPFAPFSISATTPAALSIFVFGVPATATTPAFLPVNDINPATVIVNGVAFPNATLAQDPDTANYLNGIPDAIITITPRSSLNLSPGTATFVVSGQTLPNLPAPAVETWTGTATVTVTGGSSTPPTGAVAGIPTGPVLFTEFIPPFGSNQFTPSLSQLSALSYQPIPLTVALQQFGPPQGFAQRNYSYSHPGKKLGPRFAGRGQSTRVVPHGVDTLNHTVFDRSTFHAQKVYSWTHKAPKAAVLKGVVPVQSTHETFVDNLLH